MCDHKQIDIAQGICNASGKRADENKAASLWHGRYQLNDSLERGPLTQSGLAGPDRCWLRCTLPHLTLVQLCTSSPQSPLTRSEKHRMEENQQMIGAPWCAMASTSSPPQKAGDFADNDRLLYLSRHHLKASRSTAGAVRFPPEVTVRARRQQLRLSEQPV